MINIVKTLCAHESRCLLTAYATRAVHRDLRVFGSVQSAPDIEGEVGKALDLRIAGICECADGGFVQISCVEQKDLRIIEEAVPVFWGHVGA
jgi:hypothetical protein